MKREDLRQVHREPHCVAAHHPDPLDPMGDKCDCLIRSVTDAELWDVLGSVVREEGEQMNTIHPGKLLVWMLIALAVINTIWRAVT